jgi:hypothetical protein
MPTTDPLNPAEHPTVFQKLLEPVERFVQEQSQQLPKHPKEKYPYEAFFRLLIYYFVSGSKSLKLLINTQLNLDLLPAALGLQPVPYSTCQEAFERFSPRLFQAVFQHLLSTVSFKAIPELAAFGTVCCIDGSLFPVISSMLWAAYTTHHQALKLHLCFELNRMIPVDFWVGSGNSSERQALRRLLVAGVTYIADRGYLSFQLCYDIGQAQAHFLFRTKTHLCFTVVASWPVVLPAAAQQLFHVVTDELIRCTNDPHSALYRLVRVVICHETYFLLTNRQDLTTFQLILLYACRWQVELLFRFLKRTLSGIHLIRHDPRGVTIQFYALMITALLELHLKQLVLDQYESQAQQDGFKPSHPHTPTAPPKTPPRGRIEGVEFVTWLNKKLQKYWKIGIHWLTALRNLLVCPFDEKAIGIWSTL